MQRAANVTLAGISVPVVTNYKYLGIYLDTKLLWSQHIAYIKQRCEKGINMLKFVSRRKFGATPMISLMFYRAYIRSILDYGCTLYGSAANSNLLILDRLQYKSIRISIGCMKSSPINAILSEAQESPLKFRRLYLASKFLIKLQFYTKYDYVREICYLTTENLTNSYWLRKNNPPLVDAFLESKNIDYETKKITIFHSNFNVHILKPAVILPQFGELPEYNIQLARSVLGRFPTHLNIFTDGSKSEQGVGCAYYIPYIQLSRVFKLAQICSIFTAEAIAIDRALQWALESAVGNILILSDSRSVLLAVSRDIVERNPVIFEIRNKILLLENRNIEVIFVWIKGHSGIKNNEIVDQLAKSAVSLNMTPLDQYSPQDIVVRFKQATLLKWKTDYSVAAATSRNHYFSLHPIPTQPLPYMHLSRALAVTVTRLKMNHGCFPAHLNKIGMKDSNRCPCDNLSIGDLNHIFFSCPLGDNNRDSLIQVLLGNNFQLPLNITSVVYENNTEIFKALFKFLKQSKICI